MLLDAILQEHQYIRHKEKTATTALQPNSRTLLGLQNYPNVRLLVQAQDLERLNPEKGTEEIFEGER